MEENKTYSDANEFEAYDDIDEIETKILGSTVFADLLSDAGFKTIFTCISCSAYNNSLGLG